MNIDSPKSSQAQEKGDLLYDLILSQQQDEEEIQNTLYQNQVLENFVGSNMEVKNCIFQRAAIKFHSLQFGTGEGCVAEIAAKKGSVLKQGLAQIGAHQFAVFQSHPLGCKVVQLARGKIAVFHYNIHKGKVTHPAV